MPNPITATTQDSIGISNFDSSVERTSAAKDGVQEALWDVTALMDYIHGSAEHICVDRSHSNATNVPEKTTTDGSGTNEARNNGRTGPGRHGGYVSDCASACLDETRDPLHGRSDILPSTNLSKVLAPCKSIHSGPFGKAFRSECTSEAGHSSVVNTRASDDLSEISAIYPSSCYGTDGPLLSPRKPTGRAKFVRGGCGGNAVSDRPKNISSPSHARTVQGNLDGGGDTGFPGVAKLNKNHESSQPRLPGDSGHPRGWQRDPEILGPGSMLRTESNQPAQKKNGADCPRSGGCVDGSGKPGTPSKSLPKKTGDGKASGKLLHLLTPEAVAAAVRACGHPAWDWKEITSFSSYRKLHQAAKIATKQKMVKLELKSKNHRMRSGKKVRDRKRIRFYEHGFCSICDLSVPFGQSVPGHAMGHALYDDHVGADACFKCSICCLRVDERSDLVKHIESTHASGSIPDSRSGGKVALGTLLRYIERKNTSSEEEILQDSSNSAIGARQLPGSPPISATESLDAPSDHLGNPGREADSKAASPELRKRWMSGSDCHETGADSDIEVVAVSLVRRNTARDGNTNENAAYSESFTMDDGAASFDPNAATPERKQDGDETDDSSFVASPVLVKRPTVRPADVGGGTSASANVGIQPPSDGALDFPYNAGRNGSPVYSGTKQLPLPHRSDVAEFSAPDGTVSATAAKVQPAAPAYEPISEDEQTDDSDGCRVVWAHLMRDSRPSPIARSAFCDHNYSASSSQPGETNALGTSCTDEHPSNGFPIMPCLSSFQFPDAPVAENTSGQSGSIKNCLLTTTGNCDSHQKYGAALGGVEVTSAADLNSGIPVPSTAASDMTTSNDDGCEDISPAGTETVGDTTDTVALAATQFLEIESVAESGGTINEAWKCHVCSVRCGSEYQLIGHAMRHAEDSIKRASVGATSICGVCGDLVTCFVTHMSKVHINGMYPTAKSSRSEANAAMRTQGNPAVSGLEASTSAKQPLESHVCRVCSAVFQSEPPLTTHALEHANAILESTSSLKFVCGVCGNRLLGRYLATHIRASHVPLCKQANLSNTTGHKKETGAGGRKKKIELLLKPRKCICCSLEFRDLYKFQRHALRQLDLSGDTVLCSICGIAGSDKKGMRKHIRKVHSMDKLALQSSGDSAGSGTASDEVCVEDDAAEPIKMDCCLFPGCENVEFASMDELSEHALSHAYEEILNDFICFICKQDCLHRSGLIKHIEAAHQRSLKYECPQCWARFQYRSAWIEHKKKHFRSSWKEQLSSERDGPRTSFPRIGRAKKKRQRRNVSALRSAKMKKLVDSKSANDPASDYVMGKDSQSMDLVVQQPIVTGKALSEPDKRDNGTESAAVNLANRTTTDGSKSDCLVSSAPNMDDLFELECESHPRTERRRLVNVGDEKISADSRTGDHPDHSEVPVANNRMADPTTCATVSNNEQYSVPNACLQTESSHYPDEFAKLMLALDSPF